MIKAPELLNMHGLLTMSLTLITLPIIDKGGHCTRSTLESWQTAKTVKADNNSSPLLRQFFKQTIIIRLALLALF